MRWFYLVLSLMFGLLVPRAAAQNSGKIAVGSKMFTESRLLMEIMAQLIEAQTELDVERRGGLGGTLVLFSALREGDIDLYAEYTGTAWSVVLEKSAKAGRPLRTFLAVQRAYERRYDLTWGQPFGFNNGYAIAMHEERAQALGVQRLSDLAAVGDQLRGGWSIEFLNREDGYPGLSAAYGFTLADTKGMEHGLAYEALATGNIDLTDAYTTDSKLRRYPVRLLVDDQGFFPPYHAAPVIRRETLRQYPELQAILDQLAWRISEQRMQALNDAVESEGASFATVARTFLVDEGLLDAAVTPARAGRTLRADGFWSLMVARWPVTLRLTADHLLLTGLAMLMAILLAVPLGIVVNHYRLLTGPVLGVAGVLQTIPSLALLAFMIPLLGLGFRAAVTALFLYAVLPILRNTVTGLEGVASDVLEAARGMGLRQDQILRLVALPLAMPTIMAGIRTAAVISIGVATLAAFIGAGGLGEPIATGLQLNDPLLILAGAVPAALLAIGVDALLGWLTRRLSPPTAA